MGKLDGKVAIITGSGSGIGKAAAILFSKEGAKVVVVCRTVENGEDTVKVIKEAGGKAIFIRADVSKANDVRRLVRATVDAYGRLDVLFNNAGILGEAASTVDCTGDNFDRTIATNLKGVWFGMKYAIPEMLKVGGGSIINNASTSADRGIPNLPAYAASKGGVIALSRVTAMEYADKNIRVNCVTSACIATRMFIETPTEFQEAVLARVPRHSFGEPEDVARAALFLACDESRHIIGHSLVIDGGMEADHHLAI